MAKEYLNLLAKREYKVVLGPRFVNLWLLVIVLVATFISILDMCKNNTVTLEDDVNGENPTVRLISQPGKEAQSNGTN